MQRKFSNQSTDITVLMCYVMTADQAILKTDHVIDTILGHWPITYPHVYTFFNYLRLTL